MGTGGRQDSIIRMAIGVDEKTVCGAPLHPVLESVESRDGACIWSEGVCPVPEDRRDK